MNKIIKHTYKELVEDYPMLFSDARPELNKSLNNKIFISLDELNKFIEEKIKDDKKRAYGDGLFWKDFKKELELVISHE